MEKKALFDINAEDKKLALERVIDAATPDANFYLLLILSTLIVSLGLVMNNTTIVIGGMLVAPILSPILSFGMGIVMADFNLIKQSLKVIFVSIFWVFLLSTIVGVSSLGLNSNTEILSRAEPSLPFVVVALAAGVAAAFAFVKQSLSITVPGIAVTVALLPPLAVVPLGFVVNDFSITIGSLGIFLINLVGIILSAVVIFSLMRFYDLRQRVEKKLDKEMKEKQLK